MARLNPDNEQRARQLIALYPQRRSALIPILHVLQAQDGYLTEDGMAHVGELLGLAAAEVRGTASFYEMLHTEPVGRYVVAICTNIACMLAGAYELMEHACDRFGVRAGGTSPDGMFTLEDAECLALCGNAPCLTVNWRYFGDMDAPRFDDLVDDLAAGGLDDVVPPHGVLNRVEREVGLLATGATVHPAAPGGAVAFDGVAPAAPVAVGVAPSTGPVSGMASGPGDGAGDGKPAAAAGRARRAKGAEAGPPGGRGGSSAGGRGGSSAGRGGSSAAGRGGTSAGGRGGSSAGGRGGSSAGPAGGRGGKAGGPGSDKGRRR